MKTAQRILAVSMFAIIGIASITRADNADLKDLLSGKHVPLALKLKDLDASWRRVHVSSSDGGALPAMEARLLGGAGSGVYYTKGEVILLAGETYVIAYQPPTKTFADTMALIRGGTPTELWRLTPETSLALALIQLRAAGSLTDIRPFDLDQELAEGAGVTSIIAAERDKGINASSASNLKQIGLGLMMYVDDNNNKFPDLSDAQSLKKAVAAYINKDKSKGEKSFVHPKTGKPYQPNPSLSGKDPKAIPSPTDTVVVYEAEPAEDGTRAVLFVDAHVERVNETKWLELKKTSNIP